VLRPLKQVIPLAALALTSVACATGSTLTMVDASPEVAGADRAFATIDATVDMARPAWQPSAAPVTPAVAADDDDAIVLASSDYRLTAENEPESSAVLLAQTTTVQESPGDTIEEEYDPWEPFNERMFEFNRRLDRYVLKPVATGYNYVVPDRVQVMIANAFDNASFVPRMMNSLFQGKFDGAVREFGRFLFNSTIGIGGLFDVAKIEGIEKSREDFGQTLGFYGAPAGPYLILPFLEPLTVRDGIGKGVDGFMDPLGYFVPLIPVRLILKVEEIVNDRSLNLELFQGFEESVVDMYSAVRHAYLKRREKMIKE
jgi:phospholipid-binding lipoprotein MlaA